MNILFLSLEVFNSINESNLYTDILREFTRQGHFVCSISPVERRYKDETKLISEENSKLLRLRIGNIQKTNLIEKGISTLAIEQQYINGIKKYFREIKFDLVLYATPPITFCRVIDFIKKRDGALTYLMLKDIFPQNAVDLGMFKKTGPMSVLYKYFRKKEKRLYELSDKIGCMSQANVDYVLKHNPEIDPKTVEICPNSVEVVDMSVDDKTRDKIRRKYDIPLDKKVFVYGGNLGKPQGIDFMIECLKSQEKNKDVYFLIVGDGTEYGKIETYVESDKPSNVRLMKRLPKEDYDKMVAACDVGLIFLDHRFTIPNFPSRLLSYLTVGIPVLVATDTASDMGPIAEENGFGYWCESNDVEGFRDAVEKMLNADQIAMGKNGWAYLKEYYDVAASYEIIMKHFGVRK